MNTHWKNKKATLDKEEKGLQAMEQQVGEADGLVAAKLAEMKECEAGLSEGKAALAAKDVELEEMEGQYQAMSAGISQEGGEGGEDAATLTDLIASSSQAAQTAEGDAAQCECFGGSGCCDAVAALFTHCTPLTPRVQPRSGSATWRRRWRRRARS